MWMGGTPPRHGVGWRNAATSIARAPHDGAAPPHVSTRRSRRAAHPQVSAANARAAVASTHIHSIKTRVESANGFST
jgi:hypothetical protein